MGVDPKSMSSPGVNPGRIKTPGIVKERPVVAPPAAEKVDLAALGIETENVTDRELRERGDALLAAGKMLRRKASESANTGQYQKATPTMPRIEEMDRDQTLVWTGTHYQKII